MSRRTIRQGKQSSTLAEIHPFGQLQGVKIASPARDFLLREREGILRRQLEFVAAGHGIVPQMFAEYDVATGGDTYDLHVDILEPRSENLDISGNRIRANDHPILQGRLQGRLGRKTSGQLAR